MTEIVQSNDNGPSLPNFDITLSLFKDRMDNLTSIETRPVEPKEIDHALNSRCFNAKRRVIGQSFVLKINTKSWPVF